MADTSHPADSAAGQGVLLIYTGGTLGSAPQDPADPLSPLAPAPLEKVIEMLPLYDPTKRAVSLDGRSIRLDTHSWEAPRDSSNITPADWVEMTRVVAENYPSYEGFVILHGTDTLAYTASALAFMFCNLDRPIVLTGSQRPIGQPHSDAAHNLLTSIEIAAARSLGTTVIPEVCVFFGDRLLRGCRATKLSTHSDAAFDSPNLQPLTTTGERLVVDRRAPAPDTHQEQAPLESLAARAIQVQDKLEHGIACVTLFPGMSPALLRHMLGAEGLHGVVLQTFGAGNAPSTPAFLDAIDRAVASGMVIVDVTQCSTGEVDLGAYEVSAGLLSRGVVSGMDMTLEAALAKLAVVLGAERSAEVAADRMQLNLRGEQRRSVFHLHFGAGALPEGGILSLTPERPMVGADRFDSTKLERAMLRVMGMSLADGERGQIEFKAFIDVANTNTSKPAPDRRLLGKTSKRWHCEDGKVNVFFDVTAQARACGDIPRQNTLTLLNSGKKLSWERLDLALYVSA